MPINIDGLSELSNRLKTLPARTAKRYLMRCATPAAEVVLEAMHQTVPVGLSGRLEEELDYQTKFSGGGEGTTLTVRIGPARATFWGSLQEFGTKDQPAQHWMARAWASCQDRCLSVFGTEALGLLADMEAKDK